ncbi:MAG: hypothetical protein AB1430_17280 [Pseudomonadota bacterium]
MPADQPPAKKTRGRPPLKAGEDTVPVVIRMTEPQRDKLGRLGGAQWVRDRIDKAKEPTMTTPLEQMDSLRAECEAAKQSMAEALLKLARGEITASEAEAIRKHSLAVARRMNAAIKGEAEKLGNRAGR